MIKTLPIILICGALSAFGDVNYTSSAAYNAATAGFSPIITETYSTGFTDGQNISSGQTLDGITYSNFAGYPTANITNQYNSFSGLSLGANNTASGPAETFFIGGQGITLTFSNPVTAAGVFFNVNQDTGNYGFTTNTGSSASTGSASYDTATFVFAGITSTTPFDSVTLSGDSSYNVPEIEASTLSTSATPEPSYLVVLGIGLVALALGSRYRHATYRS